MQNDEVVKHKPTSTRKFYYESYVRKVLGDNQKHFDELMKEYKAFYDEYQETKKFPEMPSIVNNLTTVKEEVPPPQTQPEANKPEEEKQKNEEAKEGENKEEKKEEEKNEKNYFRIIEKPRLNFRKIQIHNNCKPFLVDDYRYYAEKYL